MKYSFEVKTDTAIEKIWPFYEDVNKWFAWEDDLEAISLNGAFTQDTIGHMTLEGQPAMEFKLVSVIPGKSFTDRSSVPNVGDIYFIHELSNSDGQTCIKHSVEFIPADRTPDKKDLTFISQIFANVPASIFSLIEAAND
jgi:hypothetical protein